MGFRERFKRRIKKIDRGIVRFGRRYPLASPLIATGVGMGTSYGLHRYGSKHLNLAKLNREHGGSAGRTAGHLARHVVGDLGSGLATAASLIPAVLAYDTARAKLGYKTHFIKSPYEKQKNRKVKKAAVKEDLIEAAYEFLDEAYFKDLPGGRKRGQRSAFLNRRYDLYRGLDPVKAAAFRKAASNAWDELEKKSGSFAKSILRHQAKKSGIKRVGTEHPGITHVSSPENVKNYLNTLWGNNVVPFKRK